MSWPKGPKFYMLTSRTVAHVSVIWIKHNYWCRTFTMIHNWYWRIHAICRIGRTSVCGVWETKWTISGMVWWKRILLWVPWPTRTTIIWCTPIHPKGWLLNLILVLAATTKSWSWVVIPVSFPVIMVVLPVIVVISPMVSGIGKLSIPVRYFLKRRKIYNKLLSLPNRQDKTPPKNRDQSQ